ncbi:hypothetical protein RHGRI_010616 [Rhododendron griersonianum]|uniref:Dehydrin n=1 Tax=Rhododendron griersonianum TaxID=479676 RepID=A0AAV6KJ62_9ERIC|nr:hypothetical protein RHGRI_010616 [Rhododendron griersonianum]
MPQGPPAGTGPGDPIKSYGVLQGAPRQTSAATRGSKHKGRGNAEDELRQTQRAHGG